MHRPLRTPFYLRVGNLIKGLLFYNTWNWEKASDGLKLASISREERERNRPKADLEIIKPREQPRARIDSRKASKIPEGNYQTQVSEPVPEPSASADEQDRQTTEHTRAAPEPPVHPEGEYVKRRKYKRRRTSSSTGGDGFLRRVFGKE